jgi:hypothetical protein
MINWVVLTLLAIGEDLLWKRLFGEFELCSNSDFEIS